MLWHEWQTLCAYGHGKLLLRGEYMKAVLKQLRQTQAKSCGECVRKDTIAPTLKMNKIRSP